MIKIGNRRELFTDRFLIEKMTKTELRLQHPIPREIVIEHDLPWEGNTSGYHTIFKDADLFRMYYRGCHADPDTHKSLHPAVACYAESADGIHWTKPELGICEYEGSKKNNIVWAGRSPDDWVGVHNFVPFKDTHPDCAPEARYKAVGSGKTIIEEESYSGLLAFQSPDGLHWSVTRDKPIITDGRFDSQNLAFYDAEKGQYRAYYRDFCDKVRCIKMATSPDFLNWTEGKCLEYPGAPAEHLYTNQIDPYYRAPHIYLGFPTRYIGTRDSATEGLFMSSRDGVVFERWGEALIRPGLNPARWGNRSNYIWRGMIETESDIPGAPKELSIYSIEGYYKGKTNCVRRFTLRIDGFVSVNAPLSGGEMLTKPFTFTGDKLLINFSTSAAGSLGVEIQEESGSPVEGFALADGCEIYGDEIEHSVEWKNGCPLSSLANRPIRLRFVVKDADLYSMKFS